MKQDIKYSGYSAVPSDFECSDGALATSLNLICEDGAIAPLPQPTIITTVDNGHKQFLFIHKTNLFTHYIFYDNNLNRLFWSEGPDGSLNKIDTPCPTLSHLNAIGNTLIAFGSVRTFYFLWKNSSYIALGDHIPDIEVSFGLVGHPRLYSNSGDDGSTFEIELAEPIPFRQFLTPSGIKYLPTEDLNDKNKSRVTEQMMAKVNKFIYDQTVSKGRFCFPFFVRYALRLYDGSLVGHSAPILMNPSTLPAPIPLIGSYAVKDGASAKFTGCDVMLVAAELDYQVIHNSEYYRLADWADIVTGIEVFISKPIYTYEQDGKIQSFNDHDNFSTKFIGKLFHKNYNDDGTPKFASKPTADCVLSPAAYPVKVAASSGNRHFLDYYAEWPYDIIYELYFSPQRNYPGQSFKLPEFSEGKMRESIENCSSFYFLKTISFDDAKSSTRASLHIDDDYLQSLVAREVMTDDYLSHDRLAAGSSYVYNSRLNLSGVKRSPFKGFDAVSMFSFCNAGHPAIQRTADSSKPYYEVAIPGGSTITLQVFIEEGGLTYVVNANATNAFGRWLSEMRYTGASDSVGYRTKQSWGCYLFYPNINATKIVVGDNMYVKDNAAGFGGEFVIDLKPHDFLNGAYAFVGYGSERLHNRTNDSTPTITPDPSGEYMIPSPNKIYTSEVNNPFLYPAIGINTVGSGNVMRLCTAAKALSQGQFGQFPLYAFTDEGVWAMEVSANGAYSARQPITRDVCVNPDAITQIDSAVLFPTARGIMLISGSQTRCISEDINSEFTFNLSTLPGLNSLKTDFGCGNDTDSSHLTIAKFSDFLSGCGMLYDYPHQRIIIFNSKYSYAYVYSLKSNLWGMMHSDINRSVNSYPEALAVTNAGDLVDFSSYSDSLLSQLLVSRPLKLAQPDIHKTIDTIIQRGHFRKGHVQSILYGSRDLYKWHLVWSSKDHFLRGFRGTPYKYFRIALLCNLTPGESILGASVQFTPKLTNQPR